MKVSDFSDDQIVAAVPGNSPREGGRAWHICQRLGILDGKQFAAMHRRLCRLERTGKVHRCARYSAVNCIYWRAGEAEAK